MKTNWSLAKGTGPEVRSGDPIWLCFWERIKEPANLLLRGQHQGGGTEQNKNPVFKCQLFILCAIDPEWCQMFGGCSETKGSRRYRTSDTSQKAGFPKNLRGGNTHSQMCPTEGIPVAPSLLPSAVKTFQPRFFLLRGRQRENLILR